MATLYTQQDSNIRKTWLLMAFFLVGVMLLGWFISLYVGDPMILVITVIFAVVMNIGAYWFSDSIVIKMTGAQAVKREEQPELYRIVENLSITAGLPLPKLYVVNDSSPNAFATGRNAEHAAVAVTTGLLQILNHTELEGVLAHELSHIGNRDMLVSTVAVVLAGFVAIVANIFLRMSFRGGGNSDERLNPIVLVVGIIGIILAPIAAQCIQLAISRKREYLADASGALLTRYPEGLASALEKISAHAQPMQKANHATAHLFISDPFCGGSDKRGIGEKISGLFATHPPIRERVNILRGMEV